MPRVDQVGTTVWEGPAQRTQHVYTAKETESKKMGKHSYGHLIDVEKANRPNPCQRAMIRFKERTDHTRARLHVSTSFYSSDETASREGKAQMSYAT